MRKLVWLLLLVVVTGCGMFQTEEPKKEEKLTFQGRTITAKRFRCVHNLMSDFREHATITEVVNACRTIVICKNCREIQK